MSTSLEKELQTLRKAITFMAKEVRVMKESSKKTVQATRSVKFRPTIGVPFLMTIGKRFRTIIVQVNAEWETKGMVDGKEVVVTKSGKRMVDMSLLLNGKYVQVHTNMLDREDVTCTNLDPRLVHLIAPTVKLYAGKNNGDFRLALEGKNQNGDLLHGKKSVKAGKKSVKAGKNARKKAVYKKATTLAEGLAPLVETVTE